MYIKSPILLLAMASGALADPILTCGGETPDWTLTLSEKSAVFEFKRKNTFQIPQFSIAEGRDWPRAYSLISDFDTAIVLVDASTCGQPDRQSPFTAHVLTQRGETPILLSGCCETKQ